jgi:hypothetical protein
LISALNRTVPVRTEIAETMGTFRICDVTLYVPPHMTKE